MFNFSTFNKARIAHGVLASLAVILFFPVGAIFLRLYTGKNVVRYHYIWQLFGLAILISGFGLGIWLEMQIDEVRSH